MITSDQAQVAVIGCGYWGKNLVRNFAQLRALHTICDSAEASLQAQGRLYPDVRLTRSFDDVLADELYSCVGDRNAGSDAL